MAMDRYEDDGGDWNDYENLDLYDPSRPLKFDLWSKPGAGATLGQGEFRSFKVNEESVSIYDKAVKSSYSVSVQRLLWIDGYEDPTKKQEMTLVVLKMVFTSLNPDTRIGHVTATLRLRDKEKEGKNHPRPEAWAPFREPERFNASTAQINTTYERDANAKAGFSGAEVSMGVKTGREISWNQVDFDEGHSAEVFRDGKPSGVLWFMKQNQRQKAGVTPEIWAAVLFSRNSSDAYLAKFSLDVHAGTREELKNNTKKFFGLKPDETMPFSVTPWKKQVCNGEGADILKSLGSLDNLGSLRDAQLRTKLNVSWGLKYQITAPGPSPAREKEAQEGHGGEGDRQAASVAADVKPSSESTESRPRGKAEQDPTAPPGVFPASAPPTCVPSASPQPVLQQGPILQPSLPPLVIGWYAPSAGVDYAARLAALEGRVAETERRIVEQDRTLFQLRQELMLKEAILDRMQQATAASSKTGG